MQEKKYNILLVYIHLRTGGIETLIVRMANWLTGKGHRVTIFLFEPGECMSLLDEGVKVIICPLGMRFFIPGLGKRFLQKELTPSFDLIYSYGPEGCYLASYIYRYKFTQKPYPVFLNGIYHPYEFALGERKSSLDRIRIHLYNNYINDKSKLFMSEEVRAGNVKILRRSIPQSTIWPIPMNDKKNRIIQRKITPYKIVSIGRFAEFKTYNLYMMDVLKELVDMGYNATWEVYGYGDLENKMKQSVKDKKLEDRILIREKIPYDKLSDVLSSAHVFVGMGTSLIEAGFCKVPCIVAIVDDDKRVTYGPLYNLPYYSCGELLSEDYPTVSVTSAICRIFEMSKDEYLAESERTYQYVREYSIEPLMQKFITISENIHEDQKIDLYPEWRFILYWLATYYEKLRGKLAVRTRLRWLIHHSALLLKN